MFNYYVECLRFLFCIGISISADSKSYTFLFVPRLLPLILARHIEFITLKFCVFFKNSARVGFSFVLPAWRWQLKNFSIGSWDSFSLKKHVTPLKRWCSNSENDKTKQQHYELAREVVSNTYHWSLYPVHFHNLVSSFFFLH